MDWTAIFTAVKPIAAQGARDGLRLIGMGLATHGFVQNGAGVEAFVGAGMTLAGLFWGWFTTSGYLQVGALLKKITAQHTQANAVEAAKALPSGAAVETSLNKATVQAVTTALLVAFMLSALAIAPAMAQVKLGPIGTKIKADIDGTSQNTAVGAPAPTIKPQELMQKIVALAAPDLVYAVALATKANTNAATVRLGCLKAIQALNAQVSGTGLTDATGNPLTTPAEPHIFTDLEQAAEGIDALSPTGPLFTSCAGAAALAGMNVLAFINAMVAGTAAAAIVVPK